jgi:intracellular septation protein
MALDLGPLLIFFGSFKYFGIFPATAAFMAAVLVSLGIGYWIEKRLSPMPLFTAVLVIIFGGLTLYLQDATFIKMKVTVLYAFFALLLLGGLAFKRLFIKYIFAQAFDLTEPGWKKLTIRWALFFVGLAIANEIVWRTTSTATWVDFKVWGILPLTLLFALAQAPLVMKHQAQNDAGNP